MPRDHEQERGGRPPVEEQPVGAERDRRRAHLEGLRAHRDRLPGLGGSASELGTELDEQRQQAVGATHRAHAGARRGGRGDCRRGRLARALGRGRRQQIRDAQALGHERDQEPALGHVTEPAVRGRHRGRPERALVRERQGPALALQHRVADEHHPVMVRVRVSAEAQGADLVPRRIRSPRQPAQPPLVDGHPVAAVNEQIAPEEDGAPRDHARGQPGQRQAEPLEQLAEEQRPDAREERGEQRSANVRTHTAARTTLMRIDDAPNPARCQARIVVPRPPRRYAWGDAGAPRAAAPGAPRTAAPGAPRASRPGRLRGRARPASSPTPSRASSRPFGRRGRRGGDRRGARRADRRRALVPAHAAPARRAPALRAHGRAPRRHRRGGARGPRT